MKLYADYEFYVTEYRGNEGEIENFERAIVHASQYIRHVTLGKSDNYSGEELKYASCALVSAYKLSGDEDSTGQKKSENTDGYSVSYVTETIDGESSEELFKRKAYPIARQWLLGTGLLSRRVGCPHGHEF